jgi:ectoine hydroxylase-related dioxygenase (phytanoyl-CoA dioxygenase family)
VRFHFHQDSYHRRYGTELFTDVNGRGSFVQTLTAIDPMTADNGGLFVVPGSHLGGHIPTLDGRLPEGSFDRGAAIPVELAAGDTLLLSPFTIHGSGPNLGRVPRRVFINGFASPGANRRDYPGAGFGVRIAVWNDAA